MSGSLFSAILILELPHANGWGTLIAITAAKHWYLMVLVLQHMANIVLTVVNLVFSGKQTDTTVKTLRLVTL